jgi:hypothetical protein
MGHSDEESDEENQDSTDEHTEPAENESEKYPVLKEIERVSCSDTEEDEHNHIVSDS